MIVFDDQYLGDIRYKDGIWEVEGKDQVLIDATSII
jgi:hypothetical protein